MKKRVFEFFLILVLLLALTFLMYSNNPNITGNIIAQNSDYKIREVKQLSYYLPGRKKYYSHNYYF